MNYVTDFPKLYNLVSAVLGSVTTDLGSLGQIAGFAYAMRNLDMSDVNFVTVPVADVGNGTNVALVEKKAEPIWTALRTDQPVLPDQPVASASATPTAGATPTSDDSPIPGTPAASATAPPSIQSESDCAW